MLNNMSYLIDIRHAHATVPQDKKMLLDKIRGGKDSKDGDNNITKLNSNAL